MMAKAEEKQAVLEIEIRFQVQGTLAFADCGCQGKF